jgi:hypothetical protein
MRLEAVSEPDSCEAASLLSKSWLSLGAESRVDELEDWDCMYFLEGARTGLKELDLILINLMR